MNKAIHQHPISIIRYIGKYLYLLILPLIRGFFISLSGGFTAWLQSAWFDIIFICAILLFATTKWACFTLQDAGEEIRIRYGFLFPKQFTIHKHNITAICSIKRFYYAPFRVVKIKIDTPAGSNKTSDLVATLSLKNATAIMEKQKSFLGKEHFGVNFKPRNMALVALSAVSSNSFAGVVLIATFVIQSGQVFGEEFSDKIYYSLEEFAVKIAYGIPPFAASFGLIILLGWLLAFLSNLLRHYNFCVTMDETAIEISGGVITKRVYLLPRPHINYIDIRQTLFTKILKVSSIFVDTVGYGKEKDDMSAIFPVTNSAKLQKELALYMEEFPLSARQLKPKLTSIMKYTYYPILVLCFIPIGVFFLKKTFPGFESSLQWMGAMFAAPFVWLTIVRILDLLTAGISQQGNCFTLRYSKGFTFHTVVVPREKIICIKLRSSIFQRLTNKCDVLVSSFSETTKTHTVKNLDRALVEQLFYS